MRATWLPESIRAEGAPCTTYGGWSTIGSELKELRGVVVHHTASNPSSDPDGDLKYIWKSGSLVPEYNVYISRTGFAYVGACGKTNNAGEGGDNGSSTSGRVPLPWLPANGANSYVLAVAGANNGVGEPWPDQQIDSMVRTCAAICSRGVSVDHVISHFEWTKRKIDPAGNSPFAGGGDMWDMDAFRAAIWQQLQPELPEPPVPPPPSREDDDMALITRDVDGQLWVVANDFSTRYPIDQGTHDNLMVNAADRYDVVSIDQITLDGVPRP